MNKRNLALSFAAGPLGGMLSYYLTPQLVHAQSQILQAKEIRAESFLLVNDKGVILGTLSNDERPAIKLFDKNRHEFWSAGGRLGTQRVVLGK